MDTFKDILILIINSVASIFLVFVILRFISQLVRADFYNPISQTIVRFTNPTLIPLRKIIPGIFGIDIAAIVLALVVQIIYAEVVAFILYGKIFFDIRLLAWAILGCLHIATYVGFACILIMVVSSFIAPHSSHPIIILANQFIDPLMRPVRRVVPPMGGLDFSPMAVGIGILILQRVIYGFAQAASLNPNLIIGF